MRQITLRFPEVGYARLLRLCGRYGVSIRAIFESATIISLEDEHDPERHDPQVAMWDVARRLEASEAFRTAPRHKLVIRMDDHVFADFQTTCQRFGVSQNAALALVVMPWPEESPEDCLRYRRENLSRIVEQARLLDFVRRAPVS